MEEIQRDLKTIIAELDRLSHKVEALEAVIIGGGSNGIVKDYI